MNPPFGLTCSRCGAPLEINESMKIEKEQEQKYLKMKSGIEYILMNPKIRDYMIEIINQVNYEYSEDNCSSENLI